MKKIFILLSAAVFAISCNDVKEKAKETIDKGGDAVEETANDLVDDISDRLDRNLGCKLVITEGLKSRGLSTGKFYVEKDSVSGKENKIVVYFIADKDFKGSITAKVTDKKGIEAGRSSIMLDMKAGSAGYQDILFDKRTDIEMQSTIQIQ